MDNSALKEMARREASDKESRARSKFDQTQWEVAREGARFFEKLSLLSGSAIVLSVTFLGYISSRPNALVHRIGFLYSAWGALLIVLLACTYRNFFHQKYLYFTTFATWAKKAAALKQTELEVIKIGWPVIDEVDGTPVPQNQVEADLENKKTSWNSAQSKAETHATGSERAFSICEKLVHAGLIVGLLLLVFFAVANTP